MRYAIIIEKGENSYGAYVPDLPGCVAAATTKEETLALIEEAIELQLQDMKDRGQPIPAPASTLEYIEVAA